MKSLFLTLTVAVLGASVSAQSLKVPQDFETIQGAIDAVNISVTPTIQISSGTYVENLVVPASKDGLTIQGKGKVFIDGQNGTDGLIVNSSNVTIKNLTLRHAGGAGILAFAPTEGFLALTSITIDNVTVINANDGGIDLDADGASINKCTVVGSGAGIRVDGAGAQIMNTTVRNDCEMGILVNGAGAQIIRCTVDVIEDGNGIEINGNQCTVDRNKVSNCDGDMITITGTNATVSRNDANNGDSRGIIVSGDGAIVDRNDVNATCDELIEVSGNNVQVTSNKGSGSGSTGIDVSGTNSVVSKNTISDTGDDTSGIRVNSVGDAQVEQNRVDRAHEYGINVTATGGTVSKNQARNCGAEGPSEGGIQVSGDDNTVDSNTTQDCTGTGLRVIGSTNTVSKNKSMRNSINGIQIVAGGDEGGGSGLSNNLVSNNCKDNSGQGLDNGGVGTILEKNTFQKNRQDVTNRTMDGASLVDQGGNKFTTGGLMTEPEILD